jgi:formamidopyrimidine-DNA glycosylase
MPELPEVETTLRGIQKHLLNQRISNIIIRHPRLRWPISKDLPRILKNQIIQEVSRRGKYLLLKIGQNTLILHLGMSGSLRLTKKETPHEKHDHMDMLLKNGMLLRFNDPRRFGAIILTSEDPLTHPLLKKLGPEPLSSHFSKNYLWECVQKRNVAIKTLIMNSHIVVGVGNIYATESLFAAGLHPQKIAGKMTLDECATLTLEIKTVLRRAIREGGTTLKNFVDSDGKPGYFKVHLKAYGRAGLSCVKCKAILEEIKIGQRSSVFCPHCQIL